MSRCMQHAFSPKQPFSFDQTIAFVQAFPPCRGDYAIADDSITVALAIDGSAKTATIRKDRIETSDARLVPRAIDFIGGRDDVGKLYEAAEGDAVFGKVIDELRGLHHVRFLTLEEIAVYSVMMQRAPIAVASRLKQRFLDAFGLRVGGLRAFPEMKQLVELGDKEIGKAIGHAPKAARIVEVVRGVAALGEKFLVGAPYAQARDALLKIKGVGPFSAAAILLRGLGRMNELPWMDAFDEAGKAIYGARFSRAAIEKRYGDQIGYWSFYVRTVEGRRARSRAE